MIVRSYQVIPVIFGFALTCLSGETKPVQRVALVIGNAKYEVAVGPLRNSVNDAKAITKTLRGLGFSVKEEHNVSRDELLEAVAEFRTKVRSSEVAVFYYAGHGINVAGSNYLIPIKSGYQPENADELTLRLLAETKLFNAEQVIAEMSAAGGVCNLVVLDACRNTPVARTPRTRDATQSGGLVEMKAPAGSLIAFATDAGHTAQDGDGSNGLYTEELLTHLRTPGLSIEQVFKRTRAGVMERSGGKQVPAEYSRLVGDDIFLAGPSAPALAPVETPQSILRAEVVKPPSSVVMNKLPAEGRITECAEALKLHVASRGPGEYAAPPLDAMLELVKQNLKESSILPAQVEIAMKTCDTALELIRECLPSDHEQKSSLTAKAQNRRGDCLLLLSRPADALSAFNDAILLAPDDAYPIFNRGRTQLILGNVEEARTDFTAAADGRFKQPNARKLAIKALADLE